MRQHIVRGLLGFGLLAIAILFGEDLGWWALVPGLLALVFLRGCPMCWTLGLVEVFMNRKTGCADGSCGGDKAV